MDIANRFKSALAAFKKTENHGQVDPNSYLKFGGRNRMPSTWSTPEITDQDFYTGYGFAVINKRANRSVVLGKKFLFTEADEDIVKRANEEGKRVNHPYLSLIKDSIDFAERDFWYDISTYLDLEGVYYLMAVRTVGANGRVGRIQKFSLLNPYNVRPVINRQGELGGYVERNGSKQREIPKEMIIKINLLNPFDNSKTYSLADAARDAQFTLKQANDFAREAIDGNLNAPGIISSAIELPDDQFDNFVARIKGHGRGEPLFGNGSGTVSWVDMQTDLDKAALDKINSISRDVLLAVSGLSKTGVGVEESGTGREVSRTQKDDFTENAIMPQIENIIDALNLDYRKYYSDEYKRNHYSISLDNPLETDRDAEKIDVEIRESQFVLLQSLITEGYTYDIASKYARGLIELTDLGEPELPDEPADDPDETPSGDGDDPNEPDTPETPPENNEVNLELYEGYPVPVVQYIGELADGITPMSEGGSMLYLAEQSDKVRITEIEARDDSLVGVIDENSYVKLAEFTETADREAIITELNKRYNNQLVAVRHKGIKRDLNKDFYNKLPTVVRVVLDNIISKNQDNEKFEQAWSEYREHVLESADSALMMPGEVFNTILGTSSPAGKLYAVIEQEETHTHNFDEQEQIDDGTRTLLTSAQAAENRMLGYYVDQLSQGQNNPHADTEPYINDLTLPFAVWFTVIFPVFAAQRLQETARELSIEQAPVVAITEEVKQMINDFARREATSHMNTIKRDIENALTIIRSQTSDVSEIKDMLQEAFIDIQRRRASLIASNASTRIFALSQYEADKQLLERNNLIGRAFKQLFSSTGEPCPVCAVLISQTNAAPIPFTQAFVGLGETIHGEGRSMHFDYEEITAGRVHPNCKCYYKIIIKEPETEQQAALSINDIVAKELEPILAKLDEDKTASDETMTALSEMAERLNEQTQGIEGKLDQLDKRTREARQLKEELLEANDIKAKLESAEEYARQLENILDGQG